MNTSVKMSPDSFLALPPSSGSSWRTIAAAEGRASARESPDRQRSKCGKTFIKALNFYSDSDLKKKIPWLSYLAKGSKADSFDGFEL